MGTSTKWPTLVLNDGENKIEKVQSITDVLKLSDDVIRKVMSVMESEMKLGMSRHSDDTAKSSLQMEITYVRSVLDNTEEGQYLALDLGGTNFRILLIEMKAGKINQEIFQTFVIPQPVLCGQSEKVFDYIAESMWTFLNKHDLLDKNLPLGFTFSFPMEQKSINSGYLVTWTKSFKVTGGVGEDAVKNLEDAIKRKGGFSVRVVAILNDTTGTHMAGAYLDRQCEIGLILGTGSNACYMEHLDNIDKWTGAKDNPKQVIIDTEWGAFGDNGVIDFMKTEYDFQVNKVSNHVNSFTFEKLFSGMYMGEVVRLIIVRLMQDGLLFQGCQQCDKLLTQWQFGTSCISQIAKDLDGDNTHTRKVLEELELSPAATEDDVRIIQYLGSLISLRAAQLVAAGLSVLLNHIRKPEVTVAIDGSLYENHPTLHGLIMDEIHVYAPHAKCKLILAKDGSGRGAAFVAAVACKSLNSE